MVNEIRKQEAEHLLSLLPQSNMDEQSSIQTVSLFEEGEFHTPKPARSRTKYTKKAADNRRQILAQEAIKDNIPDLGHITVDTDTSTVTDVDGSKWLMPTDLMEAYKKHQVARVWYEDRICEGGAVTLEDALEKYGNEVWVKELLPEDVAPEDALLLPVDDGKPGYVTYIQINGAMREYKVYGYLADLGRSAAATPVLANTADALELDWEHTDWLCRCAQCGRELPPNHYIVNTNGRLHAICKGCNVVNLLVDELYTVPRKYWRQEECRMMERTALLYEAEWSRHLCPRGEFAKWLLGTDNIKLRMTATRHYNKPHKCKGGPPGVPKRPPSRLARQLGLIKQMEELLYREDSEMGYVSRRYVREKWAGLKWDMENFVLADDEANDQVSDEELQRVAANIIDKCESIATEFKKGVI